MLSNVTLRHRTCRTNLPSTDDVSVIYGFIESEVATAPSEAVVEEAPTFPSPEQQRTEQGKVVFENLILAGAPPMFRPFMVLDEQEKIEKNKAAAKAGKKTPKVSSTGGCCR